MDKQSNLVWIDLEMTGLDPSTDVILEIALVITNSALQEIADGPNLVIHHTQETLEQMSNEVRKLHERSGLLSAVQFAQTSLQEAEQTVLDTITRHCSRHTALLAGSSIWMDRSFLQQYMPRVVDYLHYRMIDVSSVKELVTRWYPKNTFVAFEKKKAHRALEDIRESIAELRYYQTHFFKQ